MSEELEKEVEKELEKLESYEKTRSKTRLPPEVKPCIVKLLENSSLNGIEPFIIACELHRIGKTEKQIEVLLEKQNVKQSRIRGVIKSTLTGRYNYGCPRFEEEGLCLYKSRFKCWWFNKIPRANQKPYRERDFWRYGWSQKLTPSEGMLYFAIREVEKRRNKKAGEILFISFGELADTSGLSKGWILKCCEGLKDKGLIHFKKGLQHRWNRKASEIQRIIPIPKIK